jgi:hypothetical protein
MIKKCFSGFLMLAFCFSLLGSQTLWSQDQDGQQNATETEDLAAPMGAAANAEEAEEEFELVQTDKALSLEEAIDRFNEIYAPKKIFTIHEKVVMDLMEKELLVIDRTEIGPYAQLVMVDGKVYSREKKEPEPEPEPEPQDPGPETLEGGENDRNLATSLKHSCEEIEDQKTRGQTRGNENPDVNLEPIPRQITIRDQNNQLKTKTIYSPPKLPSSEKQIEGNRGKLIKDFATSILVPKNPVNQGDESVFDDMPSADSWLDEGQGQQQ